MKLTKVSIFHYIRLLYRSALFLGALIGYIMMRIHDVDITVAWTEHRYPMIWNIIWIVFMAEMVLRLFPSTVESPGCQKQFRKNYKPTGATKPELHDNNAVMLVMLVWTIFNLIIGAFYLLGILDEWIMLLISLAFSVCDMICILFFCPFQTWFLKNKCCCACRIYNWDYAMMFTPLFFISSVYTWSLLGTALLIMLRWELLVWRYPERFSEKTNAYLHCANCTEKLCTHKKQLNRLRLQLKEFAEKRIREITGKPQDR